MVILTPLIERIIRFHQNTSPNEWQIAAIKFNNQTNLIVTIAPVDRYAKPKNNWPYTNCDNFWKNI